jgi:hypothetical protein
MIMRGSTLVNGKNGESFEKLLNALLISQISKNDYADFQRFLDFFRNLKWTSSIQHPVRD